MELHEAGQWRLHASRQVEGYAWPGARRRGDQVGIRCVFMRGGTSRGAFLHAADLPDDLAIREKLLLGMYGSPDIRQIDGLGGAHPLTSKVAIVGRSSRPDADVDFTFGQVCIDAPRVEFAGNCGNMAAAVGPFAIDAGLVTASEPVTCVRIHLTNTHTLLRVEVPVCHGLACVEGDAEVSGVPGTGARLLLDFGDVGGTLGKGLLPTGRTRDAATHPAVARRSPGMPEARLSLKAEGQRPVDTRGLSRYNGPEGVERARHSWPEVECQNVVQEAGNGEI